MRSIVTSEILYSSTFTVGFSPDLVSLSDGGTAASCFPPAVPASSAACIIDAALAGGTKSGYIFTYVPIGSGGSYSAYTLNGDPINVGSSGQRHFYTDETHVLRVNLNAVASASDPAL
jgi:hypothetical protein